MLRLICRVLWMLMYPILKLLAPAIQRWIKPTNQSLVLGTVADLTRGQSGSSPSDMGHNSQGPE